MIFKNWFYLYSNMTPSERMLEEHIKLLGERYRAQHLFVRHRHIADFALLDRKLVIEVDGPSHLEQVQRAKDIRHTLGLERDGWAVVRVSNDEVKADPGAALEQAFQRIIHRPTLAELQAAADLLPLPPPRRAKTAKRPRQPGPKRARRQK
jgi:very-short-patch-repair endonuclease